MTRCGRSQNGTCRSNRTSTSPRGACRDGCRVSRAAPSLRLSKPAAMCSRTGPTSHRHGRQGTPMRCGRSATTPSPAVTAPRSAHQHINTSTHMVTVFVDATEAAATNGQAGVTLEAGPRVGANAIEAILCTGTVDVTTRTADGHPARLRRPQPTGAAPPATARPTPRRRRLHHCGLHLPIPPPGTSHHAIVSAWPHRPRQPHHPVPAPPPHRHPQPRPPHQPRLTTPTTTTPQPKNARTIAHDACRNRFLAFRGSHRNGNWRPT